jgi:HEAT repeat protein
MDLLQFVYVLANTLAGIAILGAICVIGMRMVRGRNERRRKEQRSRLSRDIALSLQSADATDTTVGLMRRDRRLASELLQELAELISGGQRDQLIAQARAAGLERWLMNDLRSSKQERRLAAVETLGMFNSSEVIAALLGALEDRDPDVRISAALALVELDAAPPPPILVQKLNFKRQDRPLVLRRLFARIAPSHIDDMLAIAEGRLGTDVLRPFAIDAIGATGRLDLAERLAAIAGDADVTVRATVLRAIAALGRMPERDIVAAGLDDGAWEVRTQAIQAARRLDRLDLAPRIVELADDEVWWVRFRAGECLAAMREAGLGALRELAEAGAERPRAGQPANLRTRGAA